AIYGGIAFMCVDDVQPAPIPLLQIDVSRTVLVIACNDQARAYARELGGNVQRLLGSSRLDHTVTAVVARERPRLRHGAGGVFERNHRGRAHALSHLERKRPARQRHDPRPGARGERCQRRADEAYADDREGLTTLDLAAAENIHDAGQGLAWEWPA